MYTLISYEIRPTDKLQFTSEAFAVDPTNVYQLKAGVTGFNGSKGNAYIALIFLDSDNRELGRRVRWIDDFTGALKEYIIQARPPNGTRRAVAAYRINTELPPNRDPASVKLSLQAVDNLVFGPTDALEGYFDEWLYDEEQWRDVAVPVDAGMIFGTQRLLDIGSSVANSPRPVERHSDRPHPEQLKRDIQCITRLLAERNPDHREHLFNYVSYHLKRFLCTFLRVPPGEVSERILELGAFLPFTFVLHKYLGYGEVRCMDFPPWHQSRKLHIAEVSDVKGDFSIRFHLDIFDLEGDRFPHDDLYFSTIICTEVIVHLQKDPMFMLGEINRILKMGGVLVLSTPNVITSRNIRAILKGHHPSELNTYSKDGNVSSRHNREYTSSEVKLILEAAGFEIVRLETLDVWGEPDTEILQQIQAMATAAI